MIRHHAPWSAYKSTLKMSEDLFRDTATALGLDIDLYLRRLFKGIDVEASEGVHRARMQALVADSHRATVIIIKEIVEKV